MYKITLSILISLVFFSCVNDSNGLDKSPHDSVINDGFIADTSLVDTLSIDTPSIMQLERPEKPLSFEVLDFKERKDSQFNQYLIVTVRNNSNKNAIALKLLLTNSNYINKDILIKANSTKTFNVRLFETNLHITKVVVDEAVLEDGSSDSNLNYTRAMDKIKKEVEKANKNYIP